MSEMFDKISKKVYSAADNAATVAKDFFDIAKLKFELRKKENGLNDLYERLGRTYYTQITKEVDCNEATKTVIEKIQALLCEIVSLKKKIADLQKQSVCSNCAAPLKADMQYCSNCGQAVVFDMKSDDASAEENATEKSEENENLEENINENDKNASYAEI